jgi:tRNA:m4X modification enzyme
LDLKDLDISKINEDQVFIHPVTKITVVAKHLCGSATDLALNCLLRLPEQIEASLCIATCCHHACTWESYVGRELFKDLVNMTEAEFMQLRVASSWATAKKDDHADAGGTGGAGGGNEKLEIGRKVKTCLDAGRCLWILENLKTLDNVEYQCYIDPVVTPENFLILAGSAQ